MPARILFNNNRISHILQTARRTNSGNQTANKYTKMFLNTYAAEVTNLNECENSLSTRISLGCAS